MGARSVKREDYKKTHRLMFVFTLLLPLIRALIVYPAEMIAQANSQGILQNLLNIVSDLLSTLSFFAVVGIMIGFMFEGRRHLTAQLAALESLSLVLIGFLLRMLILPLLALLDEVIAPSGFYFCNWSLGQLENAEIITNIAVYGFLGILAVLLMFFVSMLVCALIRRSKKCSPDMAVTGCALVYLAFGLLSAISDTVYTLVNVGRPQTLADAISVFSPYLKLGVLTVVGWFVIRYLSGIATLTVKNDDRTIK